MFYRSLLTFMLLFIVSQSLHAQYQYKKLVWHDEFDSKTTALPDSNKWDYDLGNGCPQLCGWGNNELEYYTKKSVKNARTENGMLIMEAVRDSAAAQKYTSARLVTRDKQHWQYGRFEIRAKIPMGRGMWPAIWMLPTKSEYGNWPHSGEIDIMENVGYWQDSLFGTVHTFAYNGMKNTQKTKSIFIKDLPFDFHTYSVEWTPDRVSFYVDDKKYNEFFNEHKGPDVWPFDKEFYLIMNIAIGGNWGGKFGVDDYAFPQRMVVDYVRVYQ